MQSEPTAAIDAARPAASVLQRRFEGGGPGASRALVLKAWVAVAAHGVQPSALRRLICEASAGDNPTAAALLEQLHAMHVASLLPSAGCHPSAPAPHTHGHGAGALAPSLTAPLVEFQLEGTAVAAAAAAAAAAERASSPEPAPFAEYAGSIIDECSRRVLAVAAAGAAPEEREGGRERERDSGGEQGGEQGGERGGERGGRDEQGGGRGARVALRAGAWLQDEPVAALLPSLLLSMVGAPSPPPAAVLPHSHSPWLVGRAPAV